MTLTEQDEDLIYMRGWGQRVSGFRFDLLDRDNSYLGTVDIDRDSVPTIENNINRTIKRQMQGLRLPPSTTADINTLTQRIRPVMLLQNGSEFPLGVFLFADASRHRRLYGSVQFTDVGTGYSTESTMLDASLELDYATGIVHMWAPGTLIYDALNYEMAAAGMTEWDIDPSSARVRGGEWMVWHPDKTFRAIVNDLCRVGGYYSVYMDNTGRPQIRQVPDLESSNPDFVYDPEGGMVRRDSVVESDDLLEAPNRYVVVNSSLSDAPVWGVWDIPDSAPHSYANRGIRVTKSFDIQGVESLAEAAKAAKAQGQADYATYRWVNLTTTQNPLHDTFNVIGWGGDHYREQSWRMPLVDGADMQHEWRRVWAADSPAGSD